MASQFNDLFGAGAMAGAPGGPILDMSGSPMASTPISSLLGTVPAPSGKNPEDMPIDKLKPGSEKHKAVLEKLDAMLKFSSDEMDKHKSRWRFMEQKVQAYVMGQDYDQLMDRISSQSPKGRTVITAPDPIQIIVPYTYATLHAAATYMGSVLIGRKPVFPLSGSRGSTAETTRYMEQALQYNIDASLGMEVLWQQIWDSLLYSFGAVRIRWEEKSGKTMKFAGGQRVFEEGLIYSGNKLDAIDPYNFYPDPRTPLHKCNQLGDFMFRRERVSLTVLKDMEKAGHYKWVKEAVENVSEWTRESTGDNNTSARRDRIQLGGTLKLSAKNVAGFGDIYEGTVRLVPKDWDLGESETSELWQFAWIKNKQIIQAEPLGMMHDYHPFAVGEPTSLGYDFMSLSQAEMITVFQDILSWLVSSRMENVRAAIANTFIADPARVEVNDIRSSTIGRVIRMKQAAMGLPIQQAIQQLIVQDVTGGHLADIQTMRTMADSVTGVNDNLRGIQTAGGRRSATEARMSMQAGASRLSQLAVRLSSQSYWPMTTQMISNIQQYMPDEMWIEVSGDVENSTVNLTPDMLVGSFNYQISDGTLPLDKGALLEQWKEILFGIAQDPELRQQYSLPEIFRFVAELGGAKNIDSFKQKAPPPQIMAPGQEAPEGAVPVGAAIPAPPQMAAFAG